MLATSGGHRWVPVLATTGGLVVLVALLVASHVGGMIDRTDSLLQREVCRQQHVLFQLA